MFRRIVLSLLFAITTVFAVSSPAAALTGDRCIDPILGVHTIDPPANSYLDQKAIDSQGRVVHLQIDDSGDGYVDRLVRYNADGTLDTSFGSGGSVLVPGDSHSFRMRNVRIDSAGRIWMLRATYTDQFEVQRFLDNGSLDPAFTRFVHDETGPVDAIGDIEVAEDGTSLHIAYGLINVATEAGSIHVVTINEGGTPIQNVKSPDFAGEWVTVLDVNPQGWVSGQLGSFDEEDNSYNGFGWRAWPGLGISIPYRTTGKGLLTSIQTLSDGRTVGVGNSRSNDQTDGFVVQLSATPGAGGQMQTTGFGERSTDFGLDSEIVGEILADGTVVVLSGDDSDSAAVGFGSLAGDGGIDVAVFSSIDIQNAVPVEVVLRSDGRIAVAGFSGDSAWQATFSRPNPELSEGASAGQIQRLYSAYFERDADDTGLAYWQRTRANGMSIESMSRSFAGSPEFVSTYGELSDQQFVELIYRNVLNREGDAGGIAHWVSELANGMSRGEVMLQFSDSPENIVRTSTPAVYTASAGSLLRLYRAYFDRAPDASGTCFWIARLDSGTTLAAVSESFATSPEFVTVYGELTDQEFVELVYRNVLGRPGDTDGVTYWTGELASGARTRGEVLVGFSESPEYVLATGTLPTQ